MKDAWKMALAAIMVVIWIFCCVWVMLAKAEAQEIYRPKLRIVEVGTSHEEARDIYQRSKYYFRKLGIRPRVEFVKEYSSLCIVLNQLEWISDLTNCFKNDAYFADGWWNRGEVTFYYLPRINEYEKLWSFGASYIGSKIALGAGLGEKGAVVLIHEAIGHALGGASHVNTECNIMLDDALSCVKEGEKLEIFGSTKRTIRRNIRRMMK